MKIKKLSLANVEAVSNPRLQNRKILGIARIFALAAAVQANPGRAAAGLVAWSFVNGGLVQAGFAEWPVVALALGPSWSPYPGPRLDQTPHLCPATCSCTPAHPSVP